jgi:hypothetical protein
MVIAVYESKQYTANDLRSMRYTIKYLFMRRSGPSNGFRADMDVPKSSEEAFDVIFVDVDEIELRALNSAEELGEGMIWFRYSPYGPEQPHASI